MEEAGPGVGACHAARASQPGQSEVHFNRLNPGRVLRFAAGGKKLLFDGKSSFFPACQAVPVNIDVVVVESLRKKDAAC